MGCIVRVSDYCTYLLAYTCQFVFVMWVCVTNEVFASSHNLQLSLSLYYLLCGSIEPSRIECRIVMN